MVDLAIRIRERVGEIGEAVDRAVARLGVDAQQYWRRITPKKTGQLRMSLLVVRVGMGLNVELNFRVQAPGNEYYHVVNARKHMSEKMARWLRNNASRYIRREVDKIR